MGSSKVAQAPELPALDIEHISRVASPSIEGKTADYGRIDNEVAEYAGDVRIDIDEKTNKRLKRMIDRRILLVMASSCSVTLQLNQTILTTH